MKTSTRLLALGIFAVTTALGADKGQVSAGAQVNGIPVGGTAPATSDARPEHASCVSRCATAEVKCSSEVRRARAECSRVAANGGREPMSGHDAVRSRDPLTGELDYGYFCDYFSAPAKICGNDYYTAMCQTRQGQRYGICRDAMRNIASLRYDCYRTERDAQNFCRDELRECQAACQ